ncbi:MAG TPA: hypothetical protein VIL86_15110 [Tepidisphaeraceae bacterium]|jgi:hypothetical protein
MMTVRQIERLWDNQNYQRLCREVVAIRPEAPVVLELDASSAIPAAALGMVRLDELNQSHTALYGRLLRLVLGRQEADGGWGDAVTTALCLKALLAGQGNGLAIDRGIAYLAALQKPEGTWPRVPLRRMPADAAVSAFILYCLADVARFRESVQFDQAVQWFESHGDELDDGTARLWQSARLRCRITRPPATEASWS